MSGPSRVALVVGVSAGGMARHASMLASGLSAAGVAVRVLGPALGTVRIGSRPRLTDARVVLRLRRLLTKVPEGESPDVVHAHGLRAGALCALALAGKRRPPLVVTVHNAPPDGPSAATYRVLELIVARGADLVLCVSPDLEERMRAAGAAHVGRAVVPAEPVPGAAAAAGSGLRRGNRPVVLAAGRLVRQKGFGTLLEAAASWRDMDPVPQVVIAGEGPLRAELRDQAAALGVEALFLGHRDDVPALLAACDVFVLPSRWEGQPLVLQEALRAGAAIVATRAGGIPDLAGEGAALLVEPGEAGELARDVRRVLSDPALRESLRAAARRRAAGLPSEADGITAALAAYASAVNRR